MVQHVQQLPGYQLNEYELILDPHEELRNRIVQVKKDFSDTYQAPQALWGKPRLTLVRFSQLEMMEERIISRLNPIAMGFHPVKVELKDFGSFPSHTIYIHVATREPIRQLVRQVRDVQRLMKFDAEHKPHFIDDPYLTIVRKLLPWQYEKGWLDFSNRNFTGRFIADGMLLLRRRAGAKGYQILRRFEFKNLPVMTRQGELFG
ncbi:MAG TPA: 2'-5' RNA ligase family protein [Puia sp.]|nr:2'-5' RNA ligase family protein [Puia sp.]